MNATAEAVNPSPLDREALTAVTDLARSLQGQVDLLGALLEESAKDPDVRRAVQGLACDAGRLWSAATRLTHAAGIESAEDLEARVDAGIRAFEPVWVGIQTWRGTVPEVLDDLCRAGTLQGLAQGTADWIRVTGQARDLLRGTSPSVAARTERLLADLDRWAGQLSVAWETVVATLPEVLNSQDLRASILRFSTSLHTWVAAGQEARALLGECGGGHPARAAREILCAIRDGQQETRAQGPARGGILALIRLVFSARTVYVLRHVINIAYRVLRALEGPQANGVKKA